MKFCPELPVTLHQTLYKKIIFGKNDIIMIPCSINNMIFFQNLIMLFLNHTNTNNVLVLNSSSLNLSPKSLFSFHNKQFFVINDITNSTAQM